MSIAILALWLVFLTFLLFNVMLTVERLREIIEGILNALLALTETDTE